MRSFMKQNLMKSTLPLSKQFFCFCFLILLPLTPLYSFPATSQAIVPSPSQTYSRLSNATPILCQLTSVTTLPIRNTDYTLTLSATINQHPLSLILDTGSEGSLLTSHALKTLSLTQIKDENTHIIGTNGQKLSVQLANIPTLTLNNLTIETLTIPVSELSAIPIIKPTILGILGMDILSHYDIELDLPHKILTLWRNNNRSLLCTSPPQWSGKWEKIPLIALRNRFLIPFQLNGKKGTALLDTGARSTILSNKFAYKMGITEDILKTDPTGINSTIGKNPHHSSYYHWHQFHTLTIGNHQTTKPTLTVAPLDEEADMLLGANWFSERHIWLSPSSGILYIKK